MNYLKFLFALIVVLTSKVAISQTPTFNPFFYTEDLKTEVTPVQILELGKFLYDEEWKASKIYFNNGDSLIGYYVRYDLIKNHLEIIIDDQLKAINGGYIDRFEWFNVSRLKSELFANKKHFQFQDEKDIMDFVHILNNGESKLLKNIQLIANSTSTSPTLVQESEQSIRMLQNFYIVKEGKAFKITSRKKKNLEIINNQDVQEMIDDKHLNFTTESDLLKIIKHLNQLESE